MANITLFAQVISKLSKENIRKLFGTQQPTNIVKNMTRGICLSVYPSCFCEKPVK